MRRGYQEHPRVDEGDVSSVVALAAGVASIAIALLVSPGLGVGLGVVATLLAVWHAARGERPVMSSLTVPVGLAGVIAAAIRLA